MSSYAFMSTSSKYAGIHVANYIASKGLSYKVDITSTGRAGVSSFAVVRPENCTGLQLDVPWYNILANSMECGDI